MTVSRRWPAPRRRGYGLVEVTLCTLLIAASMAILLQVTSWTAIERRSSERRLVALQEAANQMERLTSRRFDDLTPESSKSIVLSNTAKSILRDGSLNVVIAPNPDGSAKKITIEIRWPGKSGVIGSPVRLVAWVHRRGGSRS